MRREKEDKRRLRREDCFGSFFTKKKSKVTNLVFVDHKITWELFMQLPSQPSAFTYHTFSVVSCRVL